LTTAGLLRKFPDPAGFNALARIELPTRKRERPFRLGDSPPDKHSPIRSTGNDTNADPSRREHLLRPSPRSSQRSATSTAAAADGYAQ
jgi:hypothetical protein